MKWLGWDEREEGRDAEEDRRKYISMYHRVHYMYSNIPLQNLLSWSVCFSIIVRSLVSCVTCWFWFPVFSVSGSTWSKTTISETWHLFNGTFNLDSSQRIHLTVLLNKCFYLETEGAVTLTVDSATTESRVHHCQSNHRHTADPILFQKLLTIPESHNMAHCDRG